MAWSPIISFLYNDDEIPYTKGEATAFSFIATIVSTSSSHLGVS